MTVAEKYLWQELRKKQLAGFKFRRQFSIGGFVVDFYCMATKLAIEVDGAIIKPLKSMIKQEKRPLSNLVLNFLGSLTRKLYITGK